MDIVVAGGHGQVALRLLRMLAEGGDRARGLIRNPDHAADLEAAGAEPILCDLEREDDVTPFVEGADAVVFAAGAGPGSGAARKRTMDLGGAVKLMDAARAAGVDRYVMVSSMGADRAERASGPMGPYLEAKAEADAALMATDLEWTIVRPGALTDDPGTGRIRVGAELERGDVTRDDVAATLAAVLRTGAAARVAFELRGGDTPIDEALASL